MKPELTTAAWQRANSWRKPPMDVYAEWTMIEVEDVSARIPVGSPIWVGGTLADALKLAQHHWPNARWVAVLP